MATATAHEAYARETKAVDVAEQRITLSLSKAESLALSAIFGRVGGSPTLSARGHIDSIAEALRSVGIESFLQASGDHELRSPGALYFENRRRHSKTRYWKSTDSDGFEWRQAPGGPIEWRQIFGTDWRISGYKHPDDLKRAVEVDSENG
jgi:hypothetical protein